MKNRYVLYAGISLASAQLLCASAAGSNSAAQPNANTDSAPVKAAAVSAPGMGNGNSATPAWNPITLGNAQAHPTRILARYKSGARTSLSQETLERASSAARQHYQLVPGLVLLDEADPQRLAAGATADMDTLRARLLSRIETLKASGLFEYVEPDYLRHATLAPTDQAFVEGRLWGLMNSGQDGGIAGADIGATNAWSLTTGDTNVLVAVIDTGVRYTHGDLAAQMWSNPTPGSYPGYANDLHGINAILGTGDPMDDVGHGTHVAGTIGAAANDGNPTVGVAWNVRIMACKFLGDGGGLSSQELTCIDYAVTHGARIINASYGGYGRSQAEFDAINAAGSQGVLFVAAAANDALNNDQIPSYPASFALDNVVSVAAIDRRDRLAVFSNYGERSVHLGAPGVEIYSSYNGSDSSYDVLDGTSMAAPHVSGAAALILGLYPSADLSEVRQRLLLGVTRIPALDRRTTTGGRLNAYKSLTISGSGVLTMTVQPPSGSALLLSSVQTINVRLTDLFSIRDGTVTAVIPGVTNLTFTNDGTPPDAVAGDGIYSAALQVPSSTNPITMTVIASAPGKVGATNTVEYIVLPPPPNDYFTNATKAPAAGGLYLANNRFGTLEPGEPLHADVPDQAASLWWSWVPANNTNVFLDTTGSAVDTVLAVYTGSALTNLVPVAATNSNLGIRRPAILQFAANAGVAYRIALASADTNSLGSLQLRIAPGGQRDSAAPTVAVNSPGNGTTVTDPLIMVVGNAFDQVPNATGVSEVQVSVNGAIAQSALGTTNWSAPALLNPGLNSIEARAVDQAGNFSTPVTIQVRYLFPAPANDFVANALVLTGLSSTNFAVTTNATKEVGEPNHAGSVGGRSIWWTFQAPADGLLALNTTNSMFDTLLALYTGTNASGLTLIAANDDAYSAAPGGFSFLSQAVRANQTYRIAVDGYDGASGDLVLTHSFTPASVFHINVGPTPGGVVEVTTTNIFGGIVPFNNGAGDVVSNTTVWLAATPSPHYNFTLWDGTTISPDNPLAVSVSADLSVTGRFNLIQFSDGFESGNLSGLNWETSGNSPWLVQGDRVSAGLYAARSGAIGNSGVSTLKLTANVRAGVASFSYRVSSEQGWDRFGFYIDGILVQQWSGEVDWANYSTPVQAGTHTFEWRYSKDNLNSAGEDAAFIDNVNLPITSIIDPTVPIRLSLSRNGDNWNIDVSGQSGITYTLEASANLSNWSEVSSGVAVDGAVRFTEPVNPSSSARYYRAKALSQ